MRIETLAAAIQPRYKALVLLLGYCGLRIGEAGALRVADVDLLRGRVQITKAVAEVRGEAVEGPTKTYGARSVEGFLGGSAWASTPTTA
jgi:integrase